jgi:hypothetical protein
MFYFSNNFLFQDTCAVSQTQAEKSQAALKESDFNDFMPLLPSIDAALQGVDLEAVSPPKSNLAADLSGYLPTTPSAAEKNVESIADPFDLLMKDIEGNKN